MTRLEAAESLKDWTRERFALLERETVLVTEREPSLPGCPPRETRPGPLSRPAEW